MNQNNFIKWFKNIVLSIIMQSIESKINKLEKFILEIENMNTKLKLYAPESEEFKNGLCEITQHIELLEEEMKEEEDDDSGSDTDSDISFTEEEREYIETDEHYSFLKRYGLKPTAEKPFTLDSLTHLDSLTPLDSFE